MSRRRRTLTPDEIALWAQVVRHVAPMPGQAAPEPPPQPPAPPEPPAGDTSVVPARVTPARPKPAPVPAPPPLAPLERRLRQRLARGTHPIDAMIDLHGLRQEQAHHALRGFLARAQADGCQVVLVVTGKGGSGPQDGGLFEERGVLRRVVPHWLRLPDIRPLVVGFEEAAGHQGGAGALYVRIRRRRGSET